MSLLSQINLYIQRAELLNILTVFSKELINNFARKNGTLKRQRKVAIAELLSALLTYASTNQNSNNITFTLNGFHKCYSDMFGIDISSKALHNRLRSEGLLEVMKNTIENLSMLVKDDTNETGLKLLEVYRQSVGVNDIIMVDGSEISLRYSAYDNFNCKAKTRNPDKTNPDKKSAAIKLHTGFSIVNNMPTHIDITEAVANEREHLSPDIYEQVLYLCDRGYVSEALYLLLISKGHYFIFRGKENCAYKIIHAMDGNGATLHEFEGCKPCHHLNGSKYPLVDMAVQVNDDTVLRMIRIYNPVDDKFNYFITNIDASRVAASVIADTYRTRWSCEIMFKALKSSNSLCSINSSIKEIILLFIYASIGSYLVKKLIAKQLQKKKRDDQRKKREISLLKMASSIRDIGPLLKAMVKGAKSTIYNEISKFEGLLDSMMRTKPSQRDIDLKKDVSLLVDKIYNTHHMTKDFLIPHKIDVTIKA